MQTGQLIAGRYRLVEKAGSGGHGVVWRATDEQLERDVAIKRAVPGDSEPDAERIRLLRREARLLAKLNHPNVVTLFDVVEEGAESWLVLEYVPAHSLADQDTLSPELVAAMGAQIAGALAAVHATGIVHRDVKPGNVLVTEDDRVKLSDFGISRVLAGETTVTDAGLLAGTPGYVAPEVANGEDPSAASDVFSLGATLFAAVEGVTPVGSTTENNPMVLLRRAAAGGIATSRRGGPLAPVLSALLNVDPSKRPTAAQARILLEGVAAGRAPDLAEPPESRRSRWYARPASLVAGAIVVVLAVVAWVAFTGSPGSSTAGAAPSRSAVPQEVGTASTARVAPVVADPHTADPCALVDPVPLKQFGDTNETNDNGNFNRCDVILTAGGRDYDVKVELDLGPTAGTMPQGQIQRSGRLTIVREPESNGECDRAVLLPDRYQVEISGSPNDGNPPPANLCAMTDVATTSAVAVLAKGLIPRRTGALDPRSLISVDACSLLDAKALALFPGVDALHPHADFGNWKCEWDSTTSNSMIQVFFDRNGPLDASDGQPVTISGRPAFVDPTGYGDNACAVKVVHREYSDVNAQQTEELLYVVVTGPQPSAQRCRYATEFAAPATTALPAA